MPNIVLVGVVGKKPKEMCLTQTFVPSPRGDHETLIKLNTVTAVIQHTLEHIWQLECVSVQTYSYVCGGHGTIP